MIRILVVYPRSEDSTFDTDYYVGSHMPMVAQKWPQVTRWEVDLAGPDQPHHAVGHIYVDSMDAFGAAMAEPGTGDVMSDIVNYTNVQPTMYVSEVAASS
jgi:uncharacterized protein (TIGR02118 family)